MNSDNPDQVMANNALRSKNKKKSKGKLKTDAALTDVIGRSQKKSFWKSLFRFRKHHEDPGNSSTHVITVELEEEEAQNTPNQRLSSIFEETADPATLDPKTIAEDISEIQKTIQKMSETSNPNLIIDKLAQDYPPTEVKQTRKRTKDDAYLGYLTDISSTSSEDEDDSENKKLAENPSQGEYNTMTNLDNNSTYTDLLADDKPKGSNSIIKEGYSFEYSETSENSNDDPVEEKPEKVTFDNKVETKDTNSIIMVRPLDAMDSKVVEEFEAVDKQEIVPQENELQEEADIIVARIHKIVSGQINPEDLNKEDIPNSTSFETQPQQKPINPTFFFIPSEDVKVEEVDTLGRDIANRFMEESEPSTSSISKHSTYERQEYDETLDIESIEEETELWLQDLNDFPFISSSEMVPLEDLDDDANIDNEIYREFRLNKFFKMIQNNITMNVSIAYDPLFENEPMIQNFHSAIVEQEVRNEERNKVIRKRKMMSLLHDKQVFKDYMREIEAGNMTSANTSSNAAEEPTATIQISSTCNNLIDLNKVPRANIFNESTLLNLSTAKTKLEKFLIEENGIKNHINAVYPKQYMRVYNLHTNRVNEDGLEETNSSMGSSSISSENLVQIESETSVIKTISNEVLNEVEVVDKLSPSLQKKISAYKAIDRDVEQLITELMGHVSDLKDSCIKYGAASGESESELMSFQNNGQSLLDVKEIINEIMENVFRCKEDIIEITQGHFNQCFSFIKEFGQIDQEEKTSLSYQIKPVVKNCYMTENAVSLAENLQRANGYLSTVYEEMCEYNPVPLLENEDFPPYDDESNDNEDEHEQMMYSDNLIDFNYQPDFETELSIIHEEDEPSSSTYELMDRDTKAKASVDIAENILKFIEKSVSEKLSGVDYCDTLQDVDDDTLNISPEDNEDSVSNSSVNELKKDDEPETTKPSQSNTQESDFQTASNSKSSKFEPQPGTSKQPPNCFIKPEKSSATICSSVYHLPSVPSTELVCTDTSSDHSVIDTTKGVETLLMKQFSELPNTSTEDIKPEDLQALLAFHVPSNYSQGTTALERKSPQTNFVQILQNLNLEDTKNLTKTEVDKCIEENLKCFQESMNATIKLNQKTIDMIQCPSGQMNPNQTPDVLTIISTLSCNMPKSLRDKSQVDESEEATASTTSSKATIKAETSLPPDPQPSQSTPQQQQQKQQQPPPQEWYGNNFFSKSTNNSVPKLYQLSEKVYTKSETDNDIESLKDDTESTFSNHNFDVDTYTDISFEESTGIVQIKPQNSNSEINSQSELSIDTQYLSCSNFSSGCDNSGKSADDAETSEDTLLVKSENVVDRTNAQAANLCTELHCLMNDTLATQYLEKRFNFGINLGSLLNEEFDRKTKLNFGEQL